jgi:hypothetical protein
MGDESRADVFAEKTSTFSPFSNASVKQTDDEAVCSRATSITFFRDNTA